MDYLVSWCILKSYNNDNNNVFFSWRWFFQPSEVLDWLPNLDFSRLCLCFVLECYFGYLIWFEHTCLMILSLEASSFFIVIESDFYVHLLELVVTAEYISVIITRQYIEMYECMCKDLELAFFRILLNPIQLCWQYCIDRSRGKRCVNLLFSCVKDCCCCSKKRLFW